VASAPFPYSDHEYDEGRSSEEAKVNLGFRHDRNRFKVLAGDNEFYYEIKDGNTVIDSGKFIAHVERQKIVRARKKVEQTETYCPDDKKYCDQDEQRERKVMVCPKGGSTAIIIVGSCSDSQPDS